MPPPWSGAGALKTPDRLGQSGQVIGGRLAAFAIENEVEAHFLAFKQIAKAGPFHGTNMNEDIAAAAAIRFDEAKTILSIKRLNDSSGY